MELNVIIFIVLGWLLIGFIVATFGNTRKIGFWGTFFASLFLSPILAMLFILASDKTENDRVNVSWWIAVLVVLAGLNFVHMGYERIAWQKYYSGEQTEFLLYDEHDFLMRKFRIESLERQNKNLQDQRFNDKLKKSLVELKKIGG